MKLSNIQMLKYFIIFEIYLYIYECILFNLYRSATRVGLSRFRRIYRFFYVQLWQQSDFGRLHIYWCWKRHTFRQIHWAWYVKLERIIKKLFIDEVR